MDEAEADDGDTILGLVEGEPGKTNGTTAPDAAKAEAPPGKASKVKQVSLSIVDSNSILHPYYPR